MKKTILFYFFIFIFLSLFVFILNIIPMNFFINPKIKNIEKKLSVQINIDSNWHLDLVHFAFVNTDVDIIYKKDNDTNIKFFAKEVQIPIFNKKIKINNFRMIYNKDDDTLIEQYKTRDIFFALLNYNDIPFEIKDINLGDGLFELSKIESISIDRYNKKFQINGINIDLEKNNKNNTIKKILISDYANTFIAIQKNNIIDVYFRSKNYSEFLNKKFDTLNLGSKVFKVKGEYDIVQNSFTGDLMIGEQKINPAELNLKIFEDLIEFNIISDLISLKDEVIISDLKKTEEFNIDAFLNTNNIIEKHKEQDPDDMIFYKIIKNEFIDFIKKYKIKGNVNIKKVVNQNSSIDSLNLLIEGDSFISALNNIYGSFIFDNQKIDIQNSSFNSNKNKITDFLLSSEMNSKINNYHLFCELRINEDFQYSLKKIISFDNEQKMIFIRNDNYTHIYVININNLENYFLKDVEFFYQEFENLFNSNYNKILTNKLMNQMIKNNNYQYLIDIKNSSFLDLNITNLIIDTKDSISFQIDSNFLKSNIAFDQKIENNSYKVDIFGNIYFINVDTIDDLLLKKIKKTQNLNEDKSYTLSSFVGVNGNLDIKIKEMLLLQQKIENIFIKNIISEGIFKGNIDFKINQEEYQINSLIDLRFVPKFEIKFALSNLEIHKKLDHYFDNILSNIYLNGTLSTAGNSYESIVKNLTGSGELNLYNLLIKDFNLNKISSKLMEKNFFNYKDYLDSPIKFNNLQSAYTIENGIFKTNLSLKSSFSAVNIILNYDLLNQKYYYEGIAGIIYDIKDKQSPKLVNIPFAGNGFTQKNYHEKPNYKIDFKNLDTIINSYGK